MALTDRNIHVPLDYFTMRPPSVGESYVDPVFGTTIKRLTDSTLGPDRGRGAMAVPFYSQTSPANLDDTYYILAIGGGRSTLFDVDGNDEGFVPGGAGAENRWSRINPHWLYYIANRNQIRRWNVETGDITDIGPQFSGTISFGNGKGDVSDNDRTTVIRDDQFISVWDLQTGTPVSSQEVDGFEFTAPEIPPNRRVWKAVIAEDGSSFVVSFASGLGRGQGAEQYDSATGDFMAQLMNSGGHSAMGRDVVGNPMFFTSNSGTPGVAPRPAGCNAGIVAVTLDGNATQTCLMANVWGLSHHVTACGDGWCYVSTQKPIGARPEPGDPDAISGLDGLWYRYWNEIVRIRADGSLTERLVHHRSTAVGYWEQPHASISISGNKLFYGSNFQQDIHLDYADTYLIELDSGTPPPPPPPPSMDDFEASLEVRVKGQTYHFRAIGNLEAT